MFIIPFNNYIMFLNNKEFMEMSNISQLDTTDKFLLKHLQCFKFEKY